MITLENVTYTYPFQKNPAVRNINLHIAQGEIVLCTGRSGCGKSTLIRLINGLCPHYYAGNLEGEVLIDGETSADKTIAQISAKAGTLFQDPEQQFFALNVEDEMAFALEWKGCDKKVIEEKIKKTAARFNISHILPSAVHKLSEGQKQKVGLGSVFMQDPKIAVLDEPTANLDPESAAELAKQLLELKNSGVAVFIADHRFYWLKGIADKVIVMQNGEICAEGGFSILENAELREKYGLRKAEISDPRKTLPDCSESKDTPFLSVNGLTFGWTADKKIFNNSAFRMPAGITAMVGENGAGKTTLARLLTGLTKAENGEFYLKGEVSTPDALLSRSALVLQNADHQLYMKSTAQEIETCLKLAQHKKKQKKQELEEKTKYLANLFALGHLLERHPQSLSGGEKQRLVIACAFAKNPELLILDEPTSGLDGENMKRIAAALKTLAENGTSVLVITHDLELMEAACERTLNIPFRNYL